MKEILYTLLYYPFLNILTVVIWGVPGHFAAVGIVVLTLLVRLVLIVPSRKAAEGQRKLAELQPLLDELKTEYKNDQAALASAQMELYKKNGVSPFSSCGLALIQLPVLYILYLTILHGLTPDNPNLYSFTPRPEFINSMFFGINLTKPDHTYVLPILAALTQFWQTKLTLPPRSKTAVVDPQQAMQQNILYIFPVVTLLIAQQFPAGVALYWIVNNLFGVGQQRNVNKKRLALVGVDAVVDKAEKDHPERKNAMEKAKREVMETKTSKGVSVTVRKRNK